MMKITLLICISFYFTAIEIYSQISSDSLDLQMARIEFTSKIGKFKVGGNVVHQLDLSPYMEYNNAALAEYKMFVAKEKLSTPFAIIGLAGIITAITQIPGNKWDAVAFLGGAIITLGIGFKIHCKGLPHLNNALHLYNKSVLKN